jgi:hypothetical protein
MRLLISLMAALATLLASSALRAQTADQARLMFTVGLGQSSGGGTLWSVGRQPFIIDPSMTDTLALTRSFRRSLDVVLSGSYFPGDHLGFNVEAQLLGLATQDDCRIVETQGAIETQDLCRTIGQAKLSGASAALSGGLIYRVASHQPLHPYARVNAGLLITQQSFVKTTGTVYTVANEPAQLTLYEDRNPSTLQPYLSFGGGVVAVIGKGYQLRFELRDNWVRVPMVDGPAGRQGLKPPTSTVGKHILTATLGFDVVLERKRGRRY